MWLLPQPVWPYANIVPIYRAMELMNVRNKMDKLWKVFAGQRVKLTVISLEYGLNESKSCLIIDLLLRALLSIYVVIGELATISFRRCLKCACTITLIYINNALWTYITLSKGVIAISWLSYLPLSISLLFIGRQRTATFTHSEFYCFASTILFISILFCQKLFSLKLLSVKLKLK